MTFKKTKLNRRMVLCSAGATIVAGTITSARFARAQQALSRLTLAVSTSPPDPASHYLYYAREKGFYREYGVEVDMKGMVSATNATRAVISGEADIGWVDGVSSIIAKDQGARILIGSAFAPKLDYAIVGIKDIANMKQLEGKRFAVATVGGSTELIPRIMLEKAGGNNKAVQYVALGNSSARAQALIAKTVDATIVTSSFLPRLLSYDNIHVVADAAAEIPDFIYCWELISESGAVKKSQQLEAFILANVKAVEWAQANPDEAANLSIGLLPDANKDEIRTGIKSYLDRKYWNANGELPVKTLDFSTASLLGAGIIKQRPTYKDFYAHDIAAAVAKKLKA